MRLTQRGRDWLDTLKFAAVLIPIVVLVIWWII